jgi:hypothetical protein
VGLENDKAGLDMATFQTFWHGEQLPDFVALCLSSFLDHGDHIRLFTYRKVKVPFGVEVVDASEILPQSAVFYYKNEDGTDRSVAGFANLFRYTLLRARGGWWVDTDVLRLGGPLPSEELYLGWEEPDLIGNAILWAPPQHELMSRAEDEARAAGVNLIWAQTGPKLVTRLTSELGLLPLVKPLGVVYPIAGDDFALSASADGFDRVARATAGVPFLHLWNEMFRLFWKDGLSSPEPGSFLARKYAEHGTFRRRSWRAYVAAKRALERV